MKARTIQLTLWERLNLPQVLPPHAEKEVGRICVQLRKRLVVKRTPEIIRAYGIKIVKGKAGENIERWNERATSAFHFFPMEMLVIVINLRKIEQEKRLPTDERWLNLYEKFVEENEKKVKQSSKQRRSAKR